MASMQPVAPANSLAGLMLMLMLALYCTACGDWCALALGRVGVYGLARWMGGVAVDDGRCGCGYMIC